MIDIFEEVELDLVHTENKIDEIRRTVYMLGNQFDRIGRFCMNEIPFVVQKGNYYILIRKNASYFPAKCPGLLFEEYVLVIFFLLRFNSP